MDIYLPVDFKNNNDKKKYFNDCRVYYLYKIFYFEKHNLEINIKKDKNMIDV